MGGIHLCCNKLVGMNNAGLILMKTLQMLLPCAVTDTADLIAQFETALQRDREGKCSPDDVWNVRGVTLANHRH